MSSNEKYWIVAGPIDVNDPSDAYYKLRQHVTKPSLCSDCYPFDVPENIKFGTFDDLIRLVDESSKHDSYIQDVFKRSERQLRELVGDHSDIRIRFQFSELPIDQYIANFIWDDAKFPRTRLLRDNIDMLMNTVVKHDEEIRWKSFAYNEIKSVVSQLTKKSNLIYTSSDLTDVITPQVVGENDIIDTEHMVTMFVVLNSHNEAQWSSTYEKLDSFVVPKSLKKLAIPADSEGNFIYRVIIFRNIVDSFKAKCRQQKFVVRDFHYSEEGYAKLFHQRAVAEAEKVKQQNYLHQILDASLSEVFVCLLHMKAIRCFLDSILRFGLQTKSYFFILKLDQRSFNEKRLRNILTDIIAVSHKNQYTSATNELPVPVELMAELQDVNSFVLVPLNPFQTKE